MVIGFAHALFVFIFFQVRADACKIGNDYEIMSFMTSRFKHVARTKEGRSGYFRLFSRLMLHRVLVSIASYLRR